MQKFPRRWDKKTCIDYLQRKIILNSIAYYELGAETISDHEFDSYSKQLVELQEEWKQHNDIKETQYGYAFYDFDGTTGFHLYYRLNDKDKEHLMMITNWHFNKNTKPKQTKKKKKGGLF